MCKIIVNFSKVNIFNTSCMNYPTFTSEEYWSSRYRSNDIPWDAGRVTTPLKEYIDSLEDPGTRILIPGAGNAWEAEYAFGAGFANVFVLDISREALNRFSSRCPGFPRSNLIHENFFEHVSEYDLILEQTFFCALPPELRAAYARKMFNLLAPGGRLAGVLFDDTLFEDHPPFGGDEQEYRKYFFPLFEESIFDSCYNSIPPRKNRELFIELIRPAD